jgi:hypothetical protein
MKGTLSKTKLTRLLICSLMIAAILQVGAISIVQATDEAIERSTSPPVSPDDAVVVSSDDPNLISTQDQIVIMPENGTLISPVPENTTIREEEIQKTINTDDTTIGLPEDTNQENEIPLIAPLAQPENHTPKTLNIVLLAIALGTISTVFIAVGYKKTK